MLYDINSTHDPALRSRVTSANAPETDFPIQNLPFGVFRRRATSAQDGGEARVGTAIGDQILDLTVCRDAGLFSADADRAAAAAAHGSLNALMALGPADWSALRRGISALLREGDCRLDAHPDALVAQADAEMLLPAEIGDYTDFYCSIHHATNVGSMFRPDNPLLPNYKHIPIGYHGRASSVVASGTPVRRPQGQTKAPDADAPSFGPSNLLDYELEVGFFVGGSNALGEPTPIDQAESRLFGFCLVNDWSARDIQAWEYQPLGPFLAKSFATTISPWVVTTEALVPFRVAAFERDADDPAPLPHLANETNRLHGGVDLQLEVLLRTPKMRQAGTAPHRVSLGNFRHMYWTVAQMLVHHASNGCNLRPGDLIASGTVSGPEKGSRGCLLEMTWRGSEPLELPDGETRKFLLDGDEVLLRGFCARDGAARIGFGACTGIIEPAQSAKAETGA